MVGLSPWRTLRTLVSCALITFGGLNHAQQVFRVTATADEAPTELARGPLWLGQGVRWALIVLRSVPELVWAPVFVCGGPGAHCRGADHCAHLRRLLGKFYGQILKSGDPHAPEALLRNGSSRLQAFFFGLLPQNAAEITSDPVYRWECAIRSSVVLGFVGAGGLGQQLDSAMKVFNGGEVVTMRVVFVALVALADRVSAALRKALAWEPVMKPGPTPTPRMPAANAPYQLPPAMFDARCCKQLAGWRWRCRPAACTPVTLRWPVPRRGCC